MAGAFAISRLQNVKTLLFHRKLEVLHVLEMALQKGADPHQFLVRRRHFSYQIVDRVRRAHSRHNVFALSVDQILAVEYLFAGRRVARKGNTRRARFSHVAEHHCLDVHRCAPIVRNAIFPAINDRSIIHPRPENRADCAPELLVWILWKRFSSALIDQCFETLHKLFQIRHR